MKKRVLSFVLSLAVLLALLPPAALADGNDYASVLFDPSRVHAINISIAPEDLADLKANPLEKTKYNVTVTVDGESYEGCSFATKGNTSLSSVTSMDSDRYSYKINFGKYNKGQTCHGLDKLSLNNLWADYTYMKDYFSYRILNECGADAPLCAFAVLSVNGEEKGLYLMLECVDASFIERTQENTSGCLYKPETEQLDNAGQKDFEGGNGLFTIPEGQDGSNTFAAPGGFGNADGAFPAEGGQWDGSNTFAFPGGFGNADGAFPAEGGQWDGSNTFAFPGEAAPDAFTSTSPAPDGGEDLSSGTLTGSAFPTPGGRRNGADSPDRSSPADRDGGRGGRSFGRGGMGSSNGASLVYTDDDPESYSDIFDNAKTDIDDEDKARLIASLKALGGADGCSVLDLDSAAAYFAGHYFTVNLDSWTGNMLHNYYLYETDGILTVFPWDYNLAFGSFQMSSFSDAVNASVFSPLSDGIDPADRPMWNAVLQNSEAMVLYSTALDTLVTDYFASGRFEEEISALYTLLRPYVAADPTAFSTVEQFDRGVETLKSFCLLRAQSVRLQLDGSDETVDTGSLSLDDLGSQGGGKRDGENRGGGTARPGR